MTDTILLPGIWITVYFPAIAHGFGMRAVDLGTFGNPSERLAETLVSPGHCLINAPIPIDEDVYPMVPPGEANRVMIGDGMDASLLPMRNS